MSCGMLALLKAGIPVNKYYSSEIDKYANQVSQKNFPEIIQLGSVTEVKCKNGMLRGEPGVIFAKDGRVDLLIGGSPCQGFSFAGRQLNFDDPRSKLFFEFVRILEEIKSYNPNVFFLLENVKMKKESQDIISNLLGVEPKPINSAWFSAHHRQRLYWTNIEFDMPSDKGIYLKDIIESGYVDRDKSFCIDANYFKGGNLKQYFEKSRRQLVFNGLIQTGVADGINYEQRARTYSIEGKAPTLSTCCGGHHEPKITIDEKTYRKLTPIECERLQTVPDNFTDCVSNSQRYKMLGNGWTVDVIAHIFKNIGQEPKIIPPTHKAQLALF